MSSRNTTLVTEENGEKKVYTEFSPGYYISENSNVFSLKTKKFLKISKDGRINYKLNKKTKNEKPEYIAARIFLPKEEDKEKIYIIFKDGNPENKHISNLEWSSNKFKVQKIIEDKIIEEEVTIDGNTFIKSVKLKYTKTTGLYASEYSKIYSDKKGQLRQLTIMERKSGMQYILIEGKIDVNILIMRAFYPNETELKYVLFRDGNKNNKHYTNLIWSNNPELESESEGFKTLSRFPDYKISKKGICKSYKTKEPKIIKPQRDDDGYFRLYLYAPDGKGYNLIRSRLVAATFIENPDNLPIVDHINRKRWDDRVENLRWVTESENSQNRDMEELSLKISKPILQFDMKGNLLNKFKNSREASAFLLENYEIDTAHPNINHCAKRNKEILDIEKSATSAGYIWRYYLADKEKYVLKEGEIAVTCSGDFGDKKIDFSKYKITNHGNIINNKGEKLSRVFRTGYAASSICGKKSKNIKLHTYVGLFFVPGRTKEKNIINHKDEDKTNCHYLNLEWVTLSENVKYSSYKSMKAVDKFDAKTGIFIERFPSVTKASESVGCATDSVGNVCRLNKGTLYGYIWKFADLNVEIPDNIVIQERNNKLNKTVYQFDKEKKLIKQHKSMKEAADSVSLNPSAISNCCREISKTAYGYFWSYDSTLKE